MQLALPAVRWLSPPEPVSPVTPAACPERLRASAALEDVPAFLPVPVVGAAGREERAGPAGTRLSGSKRRAGAEADATFAAFLQRSLQRAAAAERVRAERSTKQKRLRLICTLPWDVVAAKARKLGSKKSA